MGLRLKRVLVEWIGCFFECVCRRMCEGGMDEG